MAVASLKFHENRFQHVGGSRRRKLTAHHIANALVSTVLRDTDVQLLPGFALSPTLDPILTPGRRFSMQLHAWKSPCPSRDLRCQAGSGPSSRPPTEECADLLEPSSIARSHFLPRSIRMFAGSMPGPQGFVRRTTLP